MVTDILTQFVELCILLGCDYLEPIKGVGPKSALKLLREHGSLAKVVRNLREKQAEREQLNASTMVPDDEDEDEDDEPAPTSDIELPDAPESEDDEPPQKKQKKSATRIDDSDEDEDVKSSAKGMSSGMEDDEPVAVKSTKGKAKAKATKSSSKSKAKPKPKAKGGITVPEFWPWEDAKALFLKPDVTPASELEVSRSHLVGAEMTAHDSASAS